MKEQLLYDIFLGFLLLSIWLNFINGYLPSLISSLSEQLKLSLYSLIIVGIPSLADFVFNYSGKSSKTLAASMLSAAITLVVRELFVWWKERNEIRDEIYSELYGNYRSLDYLVQLHRFPQSQPDVNFSPEWNKSVKPKWIDHAFKSHFGKLQSKNIYDQKEIDDLRSIYESMSLVISQIDHNDLTFSDDRFMNRIFLGDDNLGILSQIRDLLFRLDENKAYPLLEGKNI
jgi:hypothetical protein